MSACKGSPRKVEGDDASSVLTVLTTLGTEFSSWGSFSCASPQPIVDILSFRPTGFLCLLQSCWFVELLVTIVKNVQLWIASTMSFAGDYP